jgi:hypothetical protein
MSALDTIAQTLLAQISPSGALYEVALANANPELDALLDHFDSDEAALAHLSDVSLVARLENDFAQIALSPAFVNAAGAVETWAIPILSALVGPGAPLLSVGLMIACKVAIFALQAWAARRLAQKG